VPSSDSLKGPFKGLPSFEQADSPIFFGRAAERRLCLNSLAANRITILYAPSGVGKSSLLAAGVLPDIEAEAEAIAEDREDPQKRVRPGQAAIMLRDWNEDPLASLALRIESAMQAAGVSTAQASTSGVESLLSAWTAWMGGPVYLIFDQFERLYAEGRLSRDSIQRFIDKVAALVNGSDIWVNVLIALREDCLSVLDHIGDAVPAAKRNWILLDELGEDGAREAIQGPVNYWLQKRPSDPELSPDFIKGLLEVTLSSRAGAFKTGTRKRYNTALLQMILKERWDAAVRTGSRYVEAAGKAEGYQEGVQRWVRLRLDTIPGGLQNTAARIFSRLISSAGRPVPQSLEELVSATGQTGDPLNRENAKEVLQLLSNTSRDEFILQEIPADGNPLYTIRHDFLVKPVDVWSRDLLRSEEIRKSAWVWIEERRSEMLSGLLSVGLFFCLWQWKDASLAREFMLTGPQISNRSLRRDLFAPGAQPRLGDKLLAATSDGALFWVVLDEKKDIVEVHNNSSIQDVSSTRDTPRQRPEINNVNQARSGGSSSNERATTWQPGIAARLLRFKGSDLVVSRDTKLICDEDQGCDGKMTDLIKGRLAGIITGMRGVFYAEKAGLSVVFLQEDGRLQNPVSVRLAVDTEGNLAKQTAIAVSCKSDPQANSTQRIAELTDGGLRVRLFDCGGQGAGYFNLSKAASHIALVESPPRTILESGSSTVLKLAAADERGCMDMYSLKGSRIGRYPDAEEKEILLHWPIIQPGQMDDDCANTPMR